MSAPYTPLGRFQESLTHLKRDALAGTITGVMAVPLTVGICLMSDYPVMTGLYTVIFAGMVSFMTYLFRPGNYTGMPGVAAGLAPALALGVATFGYQNMPFVILLTSLFQAVVWKFELERYILRIVPHYLVEGLLAGVGLKIALKFLPFLYDIEHETSVWLNSERSMILVLSSVSFVLFVLLYKFYKKNMPALPYLIIMVSSVGLSFVLPLPTISIETIPFELALPLPHFAGLSGSEIAILTAKMIGFALMLGTIDIIEQVMSNVAIEKIDPLQREANSNNSLLAIWIANMGATFFGGMTNLDGLAKSTTNTVAGAETKLSNLFTSLVLLLVVLNPISITILPEYALGIIMVYSGWKMIASIHHLKADGRYALILAGVTGLLVFQFGIFEGLLLILAIHAGIQFVFMKRLHKSNVEIWQQFISSFQAEPDPQHIEQRDILQEPYIPILSKWLRCIERNDLQGLLSLYAPNAVVISPFSHQIQHQKAGLQSMYENLFDHDKVAIQILDVQMQRINSHRVDSGMFRLKWEHDLLEKEYEVRFLFVIQNEKIISEHASILSYEGLFFGQAEHS